jgi:hypothetical protein
MESAVSSRLRPARRTILGLLVAAAIAAAVAVGVYQSRSHGPKLPFYGSTAAAFIRDHGGAFDAVSGARCTHDTCTVWLSPLDPLSSRREAFMLMGADIFMTSGLGQPEGAVGASNWRFVFITNVGVLRAHCTPREARRFADKPIGPSLVRRVCHARIRQS